MSEAGFCSTGDVTKEQFHQEPLRVWWSFDRSLIKNEWLSQAWEQNFRFRDEVTYEFQREASKVGVLDGLFVDFRQLSQTLPLHHMVALYSAIRVQAPWREPEFRPAFERIFGKEMKAFPEPTSQEERDEQVRLLIADEQRKR